MLGPYHFCPLSSSSLHEMLLWYQKSINSPLTCLVTLTENQFAKNMFLFRHLSLFHWAAWIPFLVLNCLDYHSFLFLEVYIFQLYALFSRVLWLLCVPYISIWILGWASEFLHQVSLDFDTKCWISRSIWWVLSS